ncbi:hypothetical protein [Desulfuribacillus alkaliarsenatis]|uniref:Uncharacterized protein n=1 Tax=Desulfuribacillus alkaliarsenatis TaxID=766136 RepID=A0A1E5G1J8_9FIRM|nr:hypothetical protein [Desulfuribacillus alkaliarsenatis]OEF96702.1 hypothetical protein BHF68_06400 [Desulfuribacillus alkaliarsenatis]
MNNTSKKNNIFLIAIISALACILSFILFYLFSVAFQAFVNQSVSLLIYQDIRGLEIHLYRYGNLAPLIAIFLTSISVFLLPLSSKSLSSIATASSQLVGYPTSFISVWLGLIFTSVIIYLLLLLIFYFQNIKARFLPYFIGSATLTLFLTIYLLFR